MNTNYIFKKFVKNFEKKPYIDIFTYIIMYIYIWTI